ncbi:MAG: hypothetical protein JSS00_11310 [Proteobacteria bacterium]|nr:hypothetical protein [Pseudomonadota bacterium]
MIVRSPSQLPLVRIKGDTVTLLCWTGLPTHLLLLVIALLALPIGVYAMWGWWVAMWSALIPAGLVWSIYRGTYVEIKFTPTSVFVDRTEYPRFRLKQFRAFWLADDSRTDDDQGHVQVFLDLEDDSSVLLALMSGAAPASAIAALLNERLAAVRG